MRTSFVKKYSITGIVCFFIILLFGLIVPVTRDFFCLVLPFIPILLWILFIINRRKQPSKKTVIKVVYFSLIVLSGLLMDKFWNSHCEKLAYQIYPFDYGYKYFEKYIYPLFSGTNWALIVYCTASICNPIKNKFFQVMAASFLMVIFDILLEQNTEFLHLWRWYGSLLVNYQFWFISAIALHSLRCVMKVEVRNRVANVTYITIVTVFVCLLMLRSVI